MAAELARPALPLRRQRAGDILLFVRRVRHHERLASDTGKMWPLLFFLPAAGLFVGLVGRAAELAQPSRLARLRAEGAARRRHLADGRGVLQDRRLAQR